MDSFDGYKWMHWKPPLLKIRWLLLDINTLRLRPSRRHSADYAFKSFFLNESHYPKQKKVRLPTHIFVTRPQRVNRRSCYRVVLIFIILYTFVVLRQRTAYTADLISQVLLWKSPLSMNWLCTFIPNLFIRKWNSIFLPKVW